jgi:hypothetical protein
LVHFGKIKFAAAELHWIQKQVELGKRSLVKVPGSAMIAVTFTKALSYNATQSPNGLASHIQVL